MSYYVILLIGQVIQRQLEEVGEKQRGVEERGVTIEKIIRGETGTNNLTQLHFLPLPFRIQAE